MTEPAIHIEGLGKEYVIGGAESYQETFREMMASTLTAPFRKFRRLGGTDHRQERFWALKDINFDVQPGEVVGIIGRNGAGKSTLLKILSRITEPTEGKVITRGRVASLLEVGTGFHPELTGRENIYLNGAILGMSRREIQQKFDEIVEFAEVNRFIDTPVKRYSSGMFVRLAFSVAAHLEPEILLVDEVLAVGDAQFQKKCLGKLGKVSGEGRTILFVSHNMTAIRSLCAKVIWLDDGKVKEISDPSNVINNYFKVLKSQPLKKSWDSPEEAPGHDEIRLKSAKVVPQCEDGKLDVHTPVDLHFEIWNRKPRQRLNFSLVVYTGENFPVFNTVSPPGPYPAGVISGCCHIPANLLNDETYVLQLLVVEQGRVILDVKEVLSFEVLEGLRQGVWHGKWVGAVRPTLEWTVSCQDEF